MTISLSEIAKCHCAAEKNLLSIKGYVSGTYGVSYQFFRRVVVGEKQPTRNFLRRLNQAHIRLFPSEPPVTLLLPNQPPVLLGHPSSNN